MWARLGFMADGKLQENERVTQGHLPRHVSVIVIQGVAYRKSRTCRLYCRLYDLLKGQ